MKKIVVAAYNPQWSLRFKKEAKEIKAALGDNCTSIHHIGSTSVPGLAAKPKVDIIAVVKEIKDIALNLENAGYIYKGEFNIPLHYGFSKRGEIDINLHVYEEEHPEIELNLAFRDYLRSHPEACDEYTELKTQILQEESSHIKDNSVFTNYTLRKGDFIRAILKKAGFIRLRILKCNDETEWKAARNFRTKYFLENQNIDDPYSLTFNHPDHEYIILYHGVEIIGYAHIQLLPDHRATMSMVVIDENKRNQNSGSVFLMLIEKWLKVRGFNSIHAESR